MDGNKLEARYVVSLIGSFQESCTRLLKTASLTSASMQTVQNTYWLTESDAVTDD